MANNGSSSLYVSALYIYPIKSLRGILLNEAELTPQGLAHDRRFMLRQIKDDGTRRNMAIYHDPFMARFIPEFTDDGKDTFKVRFTDKELVIPLTPDVNHLNKTDIAMHGSPTTGYDMGAEYNSWFSACFGLNVELIYIGQNRRKVFGNLSPNGNWRAGTDNRHDGSTASWTETLGLSWMQTPEHEQGLSLSDVAAVLVVSQTSLNHIQRLLEDSGEADITKFRPNIVIEGVEEEYIEDFWRELDIDGNVVLLTQNCNRCVSLNVDYSTGAFSKGLPGKLWANLAKERRVDPGAKRSPVFGRYGFLEKGAHGRRISVGDGVRVIAVNEERTTFYWPFKVPS